ncbi:MAG: hypothetical protein ACK40G_12985 [Cytophagaceae bacterium]
MKKVDLLQLLVLVCLTVFTSCKKDKKEVPAPHNPNEEELITTLKLIFTDEEENESEFIFEDIDGNGVAERLDTIRLSSNKTYHVEIILLDKSKNPVDTISHEIEEEGDHHQFFFTAKGVEVTFGYEDEDENGVPIGLLTKWITGGATTNKSGKVEVVLKHQDDKPKTGNGNADLGETDIEVDFPVLIQ